MKLLIATPMYGGVCHYQYFLSAIQTRDYLQDNKIENNFLIVSNESLVPRARNYCAKYALDNDFTHMLFIDGDMVWTWEMVRDLLASDKKIVGGTYPYKQFPVTPNFNPINPHLEIFSAENTRRSVGDYMRYKEKYADPKTGEVEVKHLPTGFMLIDCEVLRTLKSRVAHYTNLYTVTGTYESFWDFFPVRVVNGLYESEDWAFCSIAREAGYKIYLNTKIITGHVGTHQFRIT